ncbi:uncharacterized protein LOC110611837 [Manihot esculenta]|uniref:Uncharacterized protein n=1 Tax=Manihot esculenta TaxID=3983 RepID=A0A2C9WBE2_MANES|nr:uncharacterized protein LOC110611837 [Manihot esculenta]OAY56042.1 hypothetical protein MANES_03G198300v8 [Manihot esculenta]
MASKSPVFPMPESHHFSDYGFDPQIDYFQFLEEARNHQRETTIDSLHFKLQKPITKDDSSRKTHNTKKKHWWRKAFLFFKWRWIHSHHNNDLADEEDVHEARARAFRASVSGPVYITESRSGSSTPYRTVNRPSPGTLAGNLTAARKGDLEIPYLSLRELNMEQQQQRMSTSALPVYLVT